jgi:hypothetical protein
MTTYTHTRIRKEYLDKLQALAVANKRSAMKQLECLIDNALADQSTPNTFEGKVAVLSKGGRNSVIQ